MDLMSEINALKPLADRFAVTWCYDWAGGRWLLDGQADAKQHLAAAVAAV